jgi:uncharacterized protein YbjT (DUF2867 family)
MQSSQRRARIVNRGAGHASLPADPIAVRTPDANSRIPFYYTNDAGNRSVLAGATLSLDEAAVLSSRASEVVMNGPTRVMLVTGATGAQGGATARALLARGHSVRFFTRDIKSRRARDLIGLGADAIPGDFEDRRALQAAMRGVKGVFSVQVPDIDGTDSERRHGFALIEAAVASNVAQFVHTSVSCAGKHESFPRWREGYWSRKYWTDKWEIEQAVRGAGFESWTVLEPAFMMDNFAQPKARYMFPQLAAGEIATVLHAGTRMQLISADDVGSFACAAFEAPTTYHGRTIELAAESLTMPEVAQTLTRVTAKRVVAVELTPEQAIASGLSPGWVRSQEWSNAIGYCADIASLQQYGIELTSFERWAGKHRDNIEITPRSDDCG